MIKNENRLRFAKVLFILLVFSFFVNSVFAEEKNSDKQICTNVDFYSGFVYTMLNIPRELFTPIFAISRIAGWSAHRIEEIVSGGRIYRPAYKNVLDRRDYIPIEKR